MLDEDDHRALLRRLDLCHFQDEAPGMPFWHPNGRLLYRLLEDAVRQHIGSEYAEVKTPQVLRRSIWEASGHWKHFHHDMFRFEEQHGECALKPVSCPGHIQIVKARSPSYRDLPLRLAEFGLCHRDEPGGTLHGLLRLRQFTQDDGHVFCTLEQVPEELERFCRSVGSFYAKFGFDAVAVALSTRPAERAGDDATWDLAEATLARAVERLGFCAESQPGAGAFYGPKLEFSLRDRQGRRWQCGTIQLDLVLPQRFDLRYVAASGCKELVVMLHRALYGSLERFLGMLLEHFGASLPPWLAPTQLRVLPVASPHAQWAAEALARFARGGLRASLDARNESLARRVAEAHEAAVPYVAIVGAREVERGLVTIRGRDAQWTCELDAAACDLAQRAANPFLA
jgi:threonyl-tRNA synthetase